ncbi:MAG: enoyl-CoA hydratase/isomerase family protein [Alphaproteobacteria bacterium]|nr:enoyl-CoA hydratase/isomerase family protein [Alphaproteobacteria bacterium]
MSDLLVIDRPDARVLRIALNRPDKRNPFDTATRDAFYQVLDEALEDETVRALIITGKGGTFCAGGDVATMGSYNERTGSDRMLKNHIVVRRLHGASKPVVAAVEGFAMGAGAGLALLCDAIVAGQGAKIGFPFFNLGLVPDYGIAHTLPQRIGFGPARLILMQAKTLKSDEALKLGLFDDVVPDADVQQSALALAQKLAAQPAGAQTLLKRMLNAEPTTLEHALDLERSFQSLSFISTDHQEGVAAFKEKRAPKFR